MVRRAIVERTPEVVEGFRMRGTEVSRMEGFADGVFGFGLALLGVVSLKVPENYEELMAAMRGFLAFGLCFAIFYGVWMRHYIYCRRFGLEDFKVRILTAIMLFVMLGYLYPLKFVTVLFVTEVLHVDLGSLKVHIRDIHQFSDLFIVYGIGFAAIQIVFYMMYLHAYKMREKLCLDELETLDTKWWTIEQAVYISVPLVSIAIAAYAPPRLAGLAGWAYFFMGFVGWIHGTMHGKRHRAIVEKMEAQGRLDGDDLMTEGEQVEVLPA